MAKNRPEALVQNAVIEYLTYKRYFFWRNNTGALKTEYGGFVRFGTVGSPDIFVVRGGEIIGLEIKAPKGGKQSDAQKAFEEGFTRAGGRYYLVTSVDQLQALGL